MKINFSIPHYLFVLLVASIWIIYDQNGVINGDGALYLKQAYMFSNGDYSKGLSVFSWPFFPYLISEIHSLSGLPLLYSGHLLNVLFFIVACYFFLKSLLLITDDKKVLLAGFLIVITSIPLMDDYLSMLLRDNGMWAGFMSGVYFYLKWFKSPSFKNALIWQLSFIFATLFRPEVFAINLSLPILGLFVKPGGISHSRSFLVSSSVLIAALICLSICLIYLEYSSDHYSLNLGRLAELYQRPKTFLNNLFLPLPMQVKTDFYYLGSMLEDYGVALKYLLLTYAFIYKWIGGLKFFHLALACVAIKKQLIAESFKRPICVLFGITLLIPAINFPTTFYVSGRYMMMNFWIVYLLGAMGLLYVFNQLKTHYWKERLYAKLTLVLIVVSYVFVVLFDKHRPNVDFQVVDWIKQNHIDINHDIYISDHRICFYLGRFDCEEAGIEGARNSKKPYLVLHFDHREPGNNNLASYQMIASFPNLDDPDFIILKHLKN